MKSAYYYMPPCPQCGSEVTGRYLKKPFMNSDYTMIESLKNGELIRFCKKVPDKNAYCEDCGFTWHELPRFVWLTSEEKDGEVARRGAEKKLAEYVKDRRLDQKPKVRGFFSGWIDF